MGRRARFRRKGVINLDLLFPALGSRPAPRMTNAAATADGKNILVNASEAIVGDMTDTWSVDILGIGTYSATAELVVAETGVAPTITTASLDAMTWGSAFSQVLAADGDTPITWIVSAGSLPSGLTLDSDGTLHGTPDASGAYDFTAQAENDTGTDTQQYTGAVNFIPEELFAASEEGGLYDPSDFSTMFQGSLGTTPVTATGQTVGLMLDKRKGLVRGSELIGDVGFDSPGSWTAMTGWTVQNSQAEKAVSASSANLTYGGISLTVGKWYEASLDITSLSGYLYFWVGSTGANTTIGTTQIAASGATGNLKWRFLVLSNTGGTSPLLRINATVTGVVDNFSIKELPGNHVIQSTAAARPVLQQDGGGKYYLDFDGVDDALSGTIPVALDAGMTAVYAWNRGANNVASAVFWVQASSGANDYMQLGGQTTEREQLLVRGLSAAYSITTSLSANNAHPINTPAIADATLKLATDPHVAYINGSAFVTNPDSTIVASLGTSCTVIMSGAAAGRGHFMYGAFVRDSRPTDDEMTKLRTWLAAKYGVTL